MNIIDKLNTITENVPKVFQAGKDAEYNMFWDKYQDYGNRRRYHRAFSNSGFFGWDSESFKPKYDIICEGDCSQCFYAWEDKTEPTNIGAILKERGITLDTSKATHLNHFFSYGKSIIGELPVISCESAGGETSGIFRNVKVTAIEKVIVTENTNYYYWFLYTDKLESIIFEGTIAKNELDMQWCVKLSKESIISVINALSTTTSGLSVTLSNVAVNKAFETVEGANDGSTSAEWLALVGTRSNWTIALA